MTELTIGIAQFLGLILSVGTIMWGLQRRQESQFEKYLDARFKAEEEVRSAGEAKVAELLKALVDSGKSTDAKVSEIERDVMNLRAELPDKYVRREDYIRGQTLIESKLDGLAMRIENWQLREVNRDRP